MKKIKFAVVLALVLFSFIGCSSDSDENNNGTQQTNPDQNNPNQNEQPNTPTDYTLSFDENYPVPFTNFFDVTIEEPADRNYCYSYTEQSPYLRLEQKNIIGSSIVLEASPYSYSKYVIWGITEISQGYHTCHTRIIEQYDFAYYNTKADGTGSTYYEGDTITLSEDTTLYCFYQKKENNRIDFSKTKNIKMKVGEKIEVSDYTDEINHTYIDIIMDDGVLQKLHKDGISTLEAIAVGTARVKATSWDDENKYWFCNFEVTDDNFTGNTLEYKLIGTWEYKDSVAQGTITFNKDKTGHLKAYLNGRVAHDTNFTWRAFTNTTYQFFQLSGTGVDSLEVAKQISNVTSTSFKLNNYLMFGMNEITTWKKVVN